MNLYEVRTKYGEIFHQVAANAEDCLRAIKATAEAAEGDEVDSIRAIAYDILMPADGKLSVRDSVTLDRQLQNAIVGLDQIRAVAESMNIPDAKSRISLIVTETINQIHKDFQQQE